jgi:hypothetical protein
MNLRYRRKLWIKDFLKDVVYLPLSNQAKMPTRQRRREGYTDAKRTPR